MTINKFNKQIINIIGIIIILYLVYFIFNLSIINRENYSNTVCSGSADCYGGICVTTNLPSGVNAFCAPTGFTIKKFRAAPLYIDDTKTAIRGANISDWTKASNKLPSCYLSLNDCAKQNPSNLKYLCEVNLDCSDSNCYDPMEAGKGRFCAPKGFNKEKYRVVNNNNDNTVISTIINWVDTKINQPTGVNVGLGNDKYCASGFEAGGNCYGLKTAPDLTPVGAGNDKYCVSEFEAGGICYGLKTAPNRTNVGHLNSAMCRGEWAGDDDLCYSTYGTTGSGRTGDHVGNGRDRYCATGRAAIGGYCT